MKWKIIDWIIRILIALGFLMASAGKLTSHSGVLEMFTNFGFPKGFHYLIGVMELAGAVLILIPRTRRFAIAILGLVVAGAAITHMIHDPVSELVRPLIFALLLAAAWLLPNKFSN